MRHLTLLSLALCATIPALVPATAQADQPSATTQACLGDLTKFLTCPAGAQRSGTECRQREPLRGEGAGEHWSGSKRQGPALFLQNDTDDDHSPLTGRELVRFAAQYKDHRKTGRVFHFDKEGRLESWDNMINDEYYGLSVDCTPEGHVSHLASYVGGKIVGISRSWRSKDGALSYAIEHDPQGKMLRSLDPTPELARRPDELCHPVRCEVTARPDTSGMPAGVTLPAVP